jgi:hypothetical protein
VLNNSDPKTVFSLCISMTFQVSYETPSYSLTIIGSEYLMIPNLILEMEPFRTWKISVEPSKNILLWQYKLRSQICKYKNK